MVSNIVRYIRIFAFVYDFLFGILPVMSKKIDIYPKAEEKKGQYNWFSRCLNANPYNQVKNLKEGKERERERNAARATIIYILLLRTINVREYVCTCGAPRVSEQDQKTNQINEEEKKANEKKKKMKRKETSTEQIVCVFSCVWPTAYAQQTNYNIIKLKHEFKNHQIQVLYSQSF